MCIWCAWAYKPGRRLGTKYDVNRKSRRTTSIRPFRLHGVRDWPLILKDGSQSAGYQEHLHRLWPEPLHSGWSSEHTMIRGRIAWLVIYLVFASFHSDHVLSISSYYATSPCAVSTFSTSYHHHSSSIHTMLCFPLTVTSKKVFKALLLGTCSWVRLQSSYLVGKQLRDKIRNQQLTVLIA